MDVVVLVVTSILFDGDSISHLLQVLKLCKRGIVHVLVDWEPVVHSCSILAVLLDVVESFFPDRCVVRGKLDDDPAEAAPKPILAIAANVSFLSLFFDVSLVGYVVIIYQVDLELPPLLESPDTLLGPFGISLATTPHFISRVL